MVTYIILGAVALIAVVMIVHGGSLSEAGAGAEDRMGGAMEAVCGVILLGLDLAALMVIRLLLGM